MSKDILKILMVEDFARDAELVEYRLKKANLSFELKRVEKEEELIQQLHDFAPDIILSDYNLPSFNGIEALKITRDLHPDLPFILISGALGEEKAVEILKKGASDYILKENLTRLPEAIARASKEAFERIERKKMEQELIRVNKELDSFVYSVSHDLRAPLTSLLGLIGLAQAEKDIDQLGVYFDMMHSSVSKLDTLIHNIVIYSRNSRVDKKNESIDFETVINDILEQLRYLPDYDKIRKTVNITGEYEFQSDKIRIHFILNNLISNAIKYSDSQKDDPFIEININIEEDKATIAIVDNGKGIPEKHHEGIFEMFYRATEENTGSGLGLYIVKEVTGKLEGTIAVESEEGKGSTFTIVIPNLK